LIAYTRRPAAGRAGVAQKAPAMVGQV